MITATQPVFLTAEDFAALPRNSLPKELVDGRIEEGSTPGLRHGYVCVNISSMVHSFVKDNDLGRVLSNDSYIVVKHRPDTVRRSDICFFSFARLPRGPVPEGIIDQVPELVFEVRSPTDRWVKILVKMAEYLDAGVSVACIVDPQAETISICRPDENCKTLTANDDFALPDILPGYRVKVRTFFE